MKKYILLLLALFSFMQVQAADEMVACTMDAKQCSDWSFVGRTGPNCEFVCPSETKTDNTTKACTREYAPVCAEIEVQCIKAPCPAVQETFSNKCEMENNSLAKFLHTGSCKADTNVWLGNMASQYCEENGWTSKIATKTDGSQYGICYFEDNRQCEEWAFYRGECPYGWRKITGYIWEYAKYCAITGNEFINKWQDKNGDDIWDCKLTSGTVVNAVEYYGLSNDANEYTHVEDEWDMIMCPMIYMPVCGNDGKTYGNSCSAQKVGVKYSGTCVAPKYEKAVYKAWQETSVKHFSKASTIITTQTLERVIHNAEKLASKEWFESQKWAILNYIWYLAKDMLHKNIYEKYIKSNISTLSPISPTLWGKWYVTNITWLDTHTAKVEYEDGHIVENMKITISLKDGKLQVTDLEKRLEIKGKFDNKDIVVKLKVPTSWEGKYSYKFVSSWVLQFNFISKGEWENMLFNINIHTDADWKKEEATGLLNLNKIMTLWGYVVSYSNVLDMPFTKDENISAYSSMLSDINEIVKTVDLIVK